jgi:hypothetical protein
MSERYTSCGAFVNTEWRRNGSRLQWNPVFGYVCWGWARRWVVLAWSCRRKKQVWRTWCAFVCSCFSKTIRLTQPTGEEELVLSTTLWLSSQVARRSDPLRQDGRRKTHEVRGHRLSRHHMSERKSACATRTQSLPFCTKDSRAGVHPTWGDGLGVDS